VDEGCAYHNECSRRPHGGHVLYAVGDEVVAEDVSIQDHVLGYFVL